MGRRAVAGPEGEKGARQARDGVIAHLRRLTSGPGGVNLAQYHAQLVEVEMIEMLTGFTRDVTLAPAFRRDCAKDLLTYARGAVQPWFHAGDTIDPNAEGRTGHSVAAEIEAAKLTAQAHTLITELTMKNVPFEQWPAELRAFADPSMASFSEVV